MFTKELREMSKNIICGYDDWYPCCEEIIANRGEFYNDESEIHYDDFVDGIPCDWFELMDKDTGEVLIIRLACGLILWLADGEQPKTIELN